MSRLLGIEQDRYGSSSPFELEASEVCCSGGETERALLKTLAFVDRRMELFLGERKAKRLRLGLWREKVVTRERADTALTAISTHRLRLRR